MFVSSFLKMALEEELGHDSQQSGEKSENGTPEQEEQVPLQQISAATNEIEHLEETDAEELSEKQLLEKPPVFDTEVKIKDGSVETELEKVSIDNLESQDQDDAKRKTFDRKCGVIATLLLLVILGGAIAAIFITRFSGKVSHTFRFATYFGDNMVLQRAPDRVTIWGYGPVLNGNFSVSMVIMNEDIPDTTKFEYTTVTQKSGGVWKFVLDPIIEIGPFTIEVKIEEPEPQTLTLKNVLFGDVWICAGQSNMQYSVGMLNNSAEQLLDLEQYSQIRVMSLLPGKANGPRTDIRQKELPWSMPTKESLFGENRDNTQFSSHFSGLCWLYGKRLYKKLNYPIGLVSATYSTSSIEDWVSPGVMEICNINVAYLTSTIYNALMHPLFSTSIYGVIWYQGESDALEQSRNYKCTLVNLIKEWREMWYIDSGGATDQNFPFGIVQLAPHRDDDKLTYGYTDIRWQQTAGYGYVPNPAMNKTFMAVAVDLPDVNSTYESINPRYKDKIADRLVLGALAQGYQQKENIFQGPFPISYSAFKSNKSLVLITDATKIDLRSEHGFEVCCANASNMTCPSSLFKAPYAPGRQWVPAPIINTGISHVTISWKDVGECSDKFVVAFRYLWRETPCSYLKCPIYDVNSKLPMPPYIKNKIKDDGKVHLLQKEPTTLV